MNLKQKLGLFSATILSAGLFALAPAHAQNTEGQQPAAEDQQGDDDIVVTGSRIRRDEFSSSSPIQVITAETATLEGLVDSADIIQGSSIAAGSVQIRNQFGGFVVDGGTGVNTVSLRGLGSNRSLVLVNGRRPGPAGVRGAVGSFDLNVIPSSIVQRYEILKDGASSIYGSDAVAGVVNVITLDRIDAPVLNLSIDAPFEGGGESYSMDGAFGFNFDRGNIVVAAEYQLREELDVGDRDYLSCSEDLVYDPVTGERIDREDRSILAGTSLAGCNNIYFNTIINALSGTRYVPSPDGVTVGPITGYRPRANQNYPQGDPTTAYYEDVLNDARFLSTDAINRTERMSLFATSNFELDIFGGVDWRNELLYTRRETTSDGWRQFFPLIGGATAGAFLDPSLGYGNDPGYDHPLFLAQAVTIWPSNEEVTVDYYSLSSQLDGDFNDNWSWTLYGTYSRSDGDYGGNAIIASESGDVQYDADAPIYDPYDPNFLSGNYSQDIYDALTANILGNTVYEQTVFTGYVSGDLFELPAGPLSVAFGAEYRNYSIDDTPDALSQAGDLWGQTSAQVTRGEDTVQEVFAELEIPVLRGVTLFEDLTLNVSARMFDYDSYGDDSVWSAGFNWQVVPTFRVRGTTGTSYRAPGLFELFLGDQTGFQSQLAIDPCIDWGTSTNANIQANCAAEGIAPDFAGDPQSAIIISGGGAGVLDAETSEANTFGIIWTPEFINLSVAVDYFEIQVNDQIAQLGPGAIIGGCYGANNYPNAFCDLFDRNPGSDPTRPFAITEVRDSYINVNEQTTDGIDLTVRYEHEFNFGDLIFEGQGTWTFSDVVFLFDPGLESGFDTSDFNGSIGDPDFVANTRVSLERGDWTYSWFTNFISRTSQHDFANAQYTYQGRLGERKIHTEPMLYHDASVRWRGDTLGFVFGVSNLFDEAPPTVGAGAATRRGNAPIFGTQYDLRGRSAFLQLTKEF